MLQEAVAGMMNLVMPIWATFVLKNANEKSFCYTSTLIVQHIALFFSDLSVNSKLIKSLKHLKNILCEFWSQYCIML